MEYYQKNYKKYVDNTINLDMSEIYQMFEVHLKPGDKILDVGFGSGRDMLYFQKKYETFGIDNVEEFVTNAKQNGLNVKMESVTNITYFEEFDGIWACASLLHIQRKYIKKVFKKLCNALKPQGVLYASFKYGNFHGNRGERYFNDFNEIKIRKYLKGTGFKILDYKVTDDIRPNREQKWLNLILIK